MDLEIELVVVLFTDMVLLFCIDADLLKLKQWNMPLIIVDFSLLK